MFLSTVYTVPITITLYFPAFDMPMNYTGTLQHLKKKIQKKRLSGVLAIPNPSVLPASDQSSPTESEKPAGYPPLDELGFHSPAQFGLPPYTAHNLLRPRIPSPTQSFLSEEEFNQPALSPLSKPDQTSRNSYAPVYRTSENPSRPLSLPARLTAEFEIFPHDGNLSEATNIGQKTSGHNDVGAAVSPGLRGALQKMKKRISLIGEETEEKRKVNSDGEAKEKYKRKKSKETDFADDIVQECYDDDDNEDERRLHTKERHKRIVGREG
ncbi:hypothetical protein BZA77DRAFT_295295 [Pyronema omphalodes]|nr:hypothetical protein BZA77DRAFT_295295 [Pyronema omphalodes]